MFSSSCITENGWIEDQRSSLKEREEGLKEREATLERQVLEIEDQRAGMEAFKGILEDKGVQLEEMRMELEAQRRLLDKLKFDLESEAAVALDERQANGEERESLKLRSLALLEEEDRAAKRSIELQRREDQFLLDLASYEQEWSLLQLSKDRDYELKAMQGALEVCKEELVREKEANERLKLEVTEARRVFESEALKQKEVHKRAMDEAEEAKGRAIDRLTMLHKNEIERVQEGKAASSSSLAALESELGLLRDRLSEKEIEAEKRSREIEVLKTNLALAEKEMEALRRSEADAHLSARTSKAAFESLAAQSSSSLSSLSSSLTTQMNAWESSVKSKMDNSSDHAINRLEQGLKALDSTEQEARGIESKAWETLTKAERAVHEIESHERRITLLIRSDYEALHRTIRELEADNKRLVAALEGSNSNLNSSAKEIERLRSAIVDLQSQVQASEARGLAIGKEAASRAEVVIRKAREEAAAADLRVRAMERSIIEDVDRSRGRVREAEEMFEKEKAATEEKHLARLDSESK